MGLDMYLTKKTYVKNWSYMDKEERHSISVKLGGKARKDIKPSRISSIEESIITWRKANHIHKWFVDNVQNGEDDCKEYYVSRDSLIELADLCQDVIERNDPSLLPTQSGFFFGSTDYDEYYFEECKITAKTIRDVLKEDSLKPENVYKGDFYYSSSW